MHQEQQEIIYLDAQILLEINRLLGEDGRVREQSLLESALATPKTVAYYEQADLIRQAAILVERIVLNHPFVDGNKRVGLVAGATFLLINGFHITYQHRPEEIVYGKEIEALIVSRDLERFLQWLRKHTQVFEDEIVGDNRLRLVAKGRISLQAAIQRSMQQFEKDIIYLKEN